MKKLLLELKQFIEEEFPDKGLLLEVKGPKGDPGLDGADGKDGSNGSDGADGSNGKDGKDGKTPTKSELSKLIKPLIVKPINGKDGKDGKDGVDGLDGSPDTPLKIVEKLESLKGDKRLDASAIKNLPIPDVPISGVFGKAVKSLSNLSDVRLTSPTDNQSLTYDSASGKWVNETVSGGSGGSGGGSGDVVGPASSVDNRIATFDGTTGKLIQDSGELLSGLVHTTGNETIAGIKTIANNTWRTQGSFGLYGQTLLVDNPGDALLFQAGQAKGDGNTGGSIQIEGGAADSSGGLNGDGGPANVIGGQGFGTGNGGVARVKSGPGGDAGNPGETLIEGGDAGATDQAGADVLLKGGTPNGSGLYGKIKMQTQSTYATTFNNNDSTANHEIVIPDADGTLVLSSELADYALDADVVHLTGDEHISGKKSFNSGLYDHIGSNVRSIDTSGRQLVNQDGEIILDWSANAIEFHDPLSGQQLTFDTTLLGASRTVTLQDGDGTLAFLSDIIGEEFETVSKNLKTYPYVITYDVDDNIDSIDYDTGSGTITKTFGYTSGDVTSITLSGSTPGGIELVKSLVYSSGNLTNVTYA